ncbi:MAG: restriction endonuclease subunit S [Tepidiphilus sp.]|nr:restriction endonuclease subunit S [Tepidiphilus sp.]MDD3432927.1 restriction endonuclease subunit S [Tepidiphilus sp.]
MRKATVRLGEIAHVTSGGTPDRERPEYWGGTIPWVKTSLIQNCEINLADIDEFITEEGLKKSAAKIIPAGSILMAMIGQGKTRGQVAILNTDAAINQNCAALILKKGFDTRYVYQQLLYRYEELRTASNSSGQQNLNAGLIRDFSIPYADSHQQVVIGAILSDWDIAIETTERLIAAKEAYIGGVTARLYHRRPGWTRHRLGDFLQEIKVLHGDGDYVIGSVGKNGIKPRHEVYSKELTSNHERNLLVKPGWLCFGLASDCMAFGINSTNQTYSVSPAYRTFQIKGADPCFFEDYLRVFNARLSKRFLITSARQGKAIDFEGLFNTECYFPSLEEQQQIASAVLLMREELDRFRQLLDALKRQKRGLMQKLLTGQWRVPPSNAESTDKEPAPC